MKIISVCVILCLLGTACAAVTQAQADSVCAPINNPALVAACDPYNAAASSYLRCTQDVVASGSLAKGDQEVNTYVQLCAAISGTNPPANSLPAGSSSQISGLSTNAVSGTQSCYTITAYTSLGQKKTTGGDTFLATVSPAQAFGVTITDNTDGTYKACYTPTGASCPFSFTITTTLAGGTTVGTPSSVTAACQSSTTTGDPHFATIDRAYTYQGTGDFFLTTLGSTIVQVRQGPCNYVGITCNTGVAIMADDGTRIEYFPGHKLRQNNITLFTSPLPINKPHIFSPDAGATQTASSTIVFNFTGGTLTLSEYVLGAGTFLNVALASARGLNGGLLAEQGRNGEVYGADAAHIEPFGNSWRTLNESESIFYYDAVLPYYVVNPDGAPQYYNCSNVTTLAATSCAPLNATSPLVAQCSVYIPNSATYYSNCVCDVTWTSDAGWAQSAIDNYITMCKAYCFGCNLANLPTSSITSFASGPGLTLGPVNSLTLESFTIQAQDILGNDRTTSGDTFVISIASGPGSISFGKPTYQSAGQYLVRYAASIDGNYTVGITYGGVNINGSPYLLQVIN